MRDCSCAEAATAVEAVFALLPGGYEVDKEAALYDDSLTYGEMSTSDLRLLVQALEFPVRELAFADLGSGVGKLVLAAASVFRSSAGYELAPERAAVAAAAHAALGAPVNALLVCGDFLLAPLQGVDVIFTHNMVFSRALQRAMQLKLDAELRPGAVVFAVLELKYAKRAVLTAELAASYNWAPAGELRPLYVYTMAGDPVPLPDETSD